MMQRFFTDASSLISFVRTKPRVIVSWCTTKSYIKYDLVGKIGEVVDFRSAPSMCNVTHYAIRFDEVSNPKSQKGLFWLPPECLEEYNFNNKEKETMKVKGFGNETKVAILARLNNDSDGSVGFCYDEVKSGDLVVCDYGYDNHSLSVRKVLAVVPAECDRDGVIDVDCEIVGKVDTTVYDDIKNRRARKNELEALIRERAKSCQQEMFWKMLAEQDDAMKALYDEFKSLED